MEWSLITLISIGGIVIIGKHLICRRLQYPKNNHAIIHPIDQLPIKQPTIPIQDSILKLCIGLCAIILLLVILCIIIATMELPTNAHLRRCPANTNRLHTIMYAPSLNLLSALNLDIFEQPHKLLFQGQSHNGVSTNAQIDLTAIN